MDIIKNLKEKLRVAFNATLTDDEKNVLKEYHAKLNGDLNPEVKAKTVITKDGKTMSFDGDLVEGSLINEVMPDGSILPATDGSYELEDGTMIDVSTGKITTIKKVEPAQTEADMSNAVKQMETKFSAQKTEFEKFIEIKFEAEKSLLINEINELKKVQLSTLSALDKILNTPIETIEFNEEPRELTALEKYQLETKDAR